MKQYREGQYIWLWSMMCFVRIMSVRKYKSGFTLWVKHKKHGEFALNTMDGSLFVARIYHNGKPSHETRVAKATLAMDVIIILVILIALGHYGGM